MHLYKGHYMSHIIMYNVTFSLSHHSLRDLFPAVPLPAMERRSSVFDVNVCVQDRVG